METGSPFDEQTYILSCDEKKEKSKRRSVTYTGLTVGQDAMLDNLQSEVTEKGFMLNTGDVNLMALHLGMKKMVNFFDHKGNVVKLKRDQAKRNNLPGVGRPWEEKALNWIPKFERLCISERIKAGVNLDEIELKN